MALLCFRLVGPEYALALLLLGHKNVENPVFVPDRCNNNDDSITPYLILVEIT